MAGLGAWLLGWLNWQMAVYLFFGGLSLQVHRWAHVSRDKLPAIVRLAQDVRLFQSAPQHWQHHRALARSYYCTTTPWLNPFLDRVGFWRALERALQPLVGSPRDPCLPMRTRPTLLWLPKIPRG